MSLLFILSVKLTMKHYLVSFMPKQMNSAVLSSLLFEYTSQLLVKKMHKNKKKRN